MAAVTSAHPAAAAHAVEADPRHYTVMFENERVRVLRIRYDAGERSVMHSHPSHVAVVLTEAHFRFTNADGSVVDAHAKAGDAVWMEGPVLHLPENAGTAPAEAIAVELK